LTPVRLAVIGAGDVAQRDYLPEAHRLADRAEIVIICGRSPERARRVAGQFGIARWTADYREALATDVDAIVNLTPAPVHEEITRAALEAGLHVYSEKPLAVTAGRARALAAEAAQRGLILVCAPSVLLFPQLAVVREVIEAGDLGAIYSARAQSLGGVPPWEGYDSDPAPFFSAESGPLIDMAVYPLHALTGLLGPVRRVAAMARRTRQSFVIAAGPLSGQVVKIEAEDQWQLVLELGQCIASVEANFATAPSAAAECELRGDLGAIAFSLLDVAAPVSVLRPDAEVFAELPAAAGRDGGPDHILGVIHLAECISSGRAPVASAVHAIHVLDVIEAARRSASSGQAESIEPPAGLRLPELTSAGGA
jgi:predicted dehydrogenase